jgi:hypothetical protein
MLFSVAEPPGHFVLQTPPESANRSSPLKGPRNFRATRLPNVRLPMRMAQKTAARPEAGFVILGQAGLTRKESNPRKPDLESGT